jgi:hypothetical protein
MNSSASSSPSSPEWPSGLHRPVWSLLEIFDEWLAKRKDRYQGEGPILVPGKTDVVDPRGDLFLVLGNVKNNISFQVCSRTLARSSPVWDTLLYGPYLEGQAQQKDDTWEVDLPEDDPLALRIILHAVHYRLDAMPSTVPFDILVQLVVVSDKYDMVASLKPFWRAWYRQTDQSQLFHEGPKRLVQHLWIAHTLGEGLEFRNAVMQLLFRANSTIDGRLFLPDAFSGNDYDLDSDEFLLSMDILGMFSMLAVPLSFEGT